VQIAAVIGNPKPASRTREAALMLAERVNASAPVDVVDLSELGPRLFDPHDGATIRSLDDVFSSDLVIFASPTFKATFTGILKLFLDLIPTNGLAGKVAVPLMLGAGPAHALAPEIFLKPVLTELGAICPTRGLYLIDSSYMDGTAMDQWCSTALPALVMRTPACNGSS
jgi:FMN reductase